MELYFKLKAAWLIIGFIALAVYIILTIINEFWRR